MATAQVTTSVSQSVRPTATPKDSIPQVKESGHVAKSMQEVYEKLGFRMWEGGSEFEEKWESPAVLVLTGSTEMETNGLVLKAPFSCRIEFGQHSLDIGNVRQAQFVA